MESQHPQLAPSLDDHPFFESHDHCIGWIDKVLEEIEILKQKQNDLEHLLKIEAVLLTAKAMLEHNRIIPSDDIDKLFAEYDWYFSREELDLGFIGDIFLKTSNYVSLELSAENHEE